MLTTLHIENYALIRETDVDFREGFVAITGETGAGKSILLGALGLLLGQRADTAVLADKGRKCIVEAQFDISGLGLEPLFAEADIDYDDQLILRREILPTGRSRAFAGDTPVQLPFLRSLGTSIIDIHSQHQTLTLADSTFRLHLLDTLSSTAGKASAMPAYAAAYADYSRLKRDLEELTSTEAPTPPLTPLTPTSSASWNSSPPPRLPTAASRTTCSSSTTSWPPPPSRLASRSLSNRNPA